MKHWKRLNNLRMDKILNDFNQSTLDPVGPVGNQDQQMRILGEMNELARARAVNSEGRAERGCIVTGGGRCLRNLILSVGPVISHCSTFMQPVRISA